MCLPVALSFRLSSPLLGFPFFFSLSFSFFSLLFPFRLTLSSPMCPFSHVAPLRFLCRIALWHSLFPLSYLPPILLLLSPPFSYFSPFILLSLLLPLFSPLKPCLTSPFCYFTLSSPLFPSHPCPFYSPLSPSLLLPSLCLPSPPYPLYSPLLHVFHLFHTPFILPFPLSSPPYLPLPLSLHIRRSKGYHYIFLSFWDNILAYSLRISQAVMNLVAVTLSCLQKAVCARVFWTVSGSYFTFCFVCILIFYSPFLLKYLG